MIYSEFKKLILSKTQNRSVIPPDAQINYKVWAALKDIARNTVPLKLVVNTSTYQGVMRKIDSVTYIRFPNRPVKDTDTIDMDDELLDAAALYVAAGIEKPLAPVHMGMYRREIDENNDRLIETDLSVGNQEGDFVDASSKFA